MIAGFLFGAGFTLGVMAVWFGSAVLQGVVLGLWSAWRAEEAPDPVPSYTSAEMSDVDENLVRRYVAQARRAH